MLAPVTQQEESQCYLPRKSAIDNGTKHKNVNTTDDIRKGRPCLSLLADEQGHVVATVLTVLG
jgi:hypothetical protein